MYVITDVPADVPVTMPDEDPTEAIGGLLLIHVPPAAVSAREMDDPMHTEVVPVITPGAGNTVTVAEAEHPVDIV